jgi:hypothetical protein
LLFHAFSDSDYWGGAFADVKIADFNLDGYPDFMSRGGSACSVLPGGGYFQNRGDGTFQSVCADMTGFPGIVLGSGPEWAVGDIDGDGDVDVVLVQGTSPVHGVSKLILRNDGTGRLVYDRSGAIPSDNYDGHGCELVDVDGDRDLDLIAWHASGQPERLYANDGRGRFTDVTTGRLPNISDATDEIVAGDIDGDGDQDLIAAVTSPTIPCRVLKNDGTGRFTIVADFTGVGVKMARLGDVDGDGDLDIFFSGYFSSDRLFANRGDGTFVDVSHQLPTQATMQGEGGDFADVDGDGDLDIVSGSPLMIGVAPRLLLNDGTGRFTEATQSVFTSFLGNSSHARAADFDRDGDVDLIIGYFAAFTRVRQYVNLERQIHGPADAIRGTPYVLDLFGRSGHTFAAFLGVRGQSVVIPGIGVWALRTDLLIPLPPVLIPPSGRTSLSIQVPNDPALVGSRCELQAADVDTSAAKIRTTGYRSLTIR